MTKRMTKKVKKILFGTSIFSFCTIPSIGTIFCNNQESSLNSTLDQSSNVVNLNFSDIVEKAIEIKQQNEKLGTTSPGYISVPVGNTGISIKVPDFSGDKQVAQRISSTYKNKPTGISTNISQKITSGNTTSFPTNNIYSILEFDKKWANVDDQTNHPVAFNLGRKSDYADNKSNVIVSGGSEFSSFTFEDLADLSSLPAFDNTNDEVQPINEKYLDDNGVLALQVTLTNRSSNNQKTTYYLLISGFGTGMDKNSSSSNPMLPASEYVNNVGDISNSFLLKNIKFSSETNLNKEVVNGSRVNNPNSGSISLTAQFNWEIPENIKFKDTFAGIIPLSRTQSGSNTVDESLKYKKENDFSVSTTWSKEFMFSGFQPAPDLSTGALIGLIIGIITTICLVSLISFGLSKLMKAYLSKKRM